MTIIPKENVTTMQVVKNTGFDGSIFEQSFVGSNTLYIT